MLAHFPCDSLTTSLKCLLFSPFRLRGAGERALRRRAALRRLGVPMISRDDDDGSAQRVEMSRCRETGETQFIWTYSQINTTLVVRVPSMKVHCQY